MKTIVFHEAYVLGDFVVGKDHQSNDSSKSF